VLLCQILHVCPSHHLQTSFEGLPVARPLEDLKAAEMGRKTRYVGSDWRGGDGGVGKGQEKCLLAPKEL
jgi:hypothetical protein